MRKVSVPVIGLALVACSGTSLDVGEDGSEVLNLGGASSTPGNSGGASGSSTAGPGAAGASGAGSTAGAATGAGGWGAPGEPAVEQPPDPALCASGTQLPIVGAYQGYVEGSALAPELGGHVRVQITGASVENGVCGSVTFGEGEPPAPATNPDVGYPSSLSYFGTGGTAGSDGPTNGVRYTILSGAASVYGTTNATRVTFHTTNAELWQSWCALQVPDSPVYFLDGQGFSMGYDDYPPSECQIGLGAQVYTLDCDKAWLLTSGVCACSATRCTSSTDRLHLNFDLNFADATQATGQLDGNTVPLYLLD